MQWLSRIAAAIFKMDRDMFGFTCTKQVKGNRKRRKWACNLPTCPFQVNAVLIDKDGEEPCWKILKGFKKGGGAVGLNHCDDDHAGAERAKSEAARFKKSHELS